MSILALKTDQTSDFPRKSVRIFWKSKIDFSRFLTQKIGRLSTDFFPTYKEKNPQKIACDFLCENL